MMLNNYLGAGGQSEDDNPGFVVSSMLRREVACSPLQSKINKQTWLFLKYGCRIRPASVANASDFVQIPLSQVPRRDTVGSTRLHGAGALVDRELRFRELRFINSDHRGIVRVGSRS
jgi:hypothetical protein